MRKQHFFVFFFLQGGVGTLVQVTSPLSEIRKQTNKVETKHANN